MLFDVSPDEPEQKKGRKSSARAMAAPPSAKVDEPKKAPYFIGERPVPALGAIDSTFVCVDESCNAGAHDVLTEHDGEWLIECAICGTRQRVAAVRDHFQPKEAEFVVADGLFAGMTFSEIERQPRGPAWLAWAAAEHPRKFVREAAKKHALTVTR